jgi:hypothetical protein
MQGWSRDRLAQGGTMRREKLPALGAVLLFTAAWFAPIVGDSAELLDGVIPGYEAFRVAIGPALQYPFSEVDLMTLRELLCALSALSNLLVLHALALVLWWPRTAWPGLRRMSHLLLFAFVINAQWIWPRGGEFLDLRIGYWLWCASFPLLALAVRRLALSSTRPPDPSQGDVRGSVPQLPATP